ncbi:MAG: hypothetical protein COB23_03585 [Methylophaga sp.]|nr:MAG: hypothetical protein COB23_03585 [Methylophaga sp.]
MQYKSILFLALVFSLPLHAEEMERLTITSCAYQAGTAREIQSIRQNEGDDWPQFEQKIKKIYKDGQGRQDLLVIGKTVYLQPTNTLPTVIYDNIFGRCVKRQQGTEPSA